MKARNLLRNPEWYYRHQVDATKDRELQREGINLTQLNTRAGSGTYRENLLYTASVVRDRIIGKQNDARRDVYYHSQYQVQVEEVLAGPVPPGVLTVCLRSGPVGDVFLTSSAEPRLVVGEQAILYLNPTSTSELAEAKAQGLWNFTDNTKVGDFNLIEKYSVQAQYVFDADNHRIGKIAGVTTGIRRVAALLDKPNFASKSFDQVV